MHFGIDYGSKLAGTTVITYLQDNKLHQVCSLKKQDADKLIISVADEFKPNSIYIDAPLSLPAAYHDKGDNFHYRVADRELGAMSPMFLGGLTARAMSLATTLRLQGIKVMETYPGAYVRGESELGNVYSKKDTSCIPSCLDILFKKIQHKCTSDIKTMHQLDGLIAWYSGHRHIQGTATIVGIPEEGLIIY